MSGGTRRRLTPRAQRELEAYEAAVKLRNAIVTDPAIAPFVVKRCERCNLAHPAYLECPTGAVAGETHRHADVEELRRLEPIVRPARELAKTDDTETAKAAAAGNPGGKASNRRVCLEAHARIREHEPLGLTDDEVAERTGLDLQEARRRCVDLRRLELLEWKHSMRYGFETRPSAGGKRSRVSVITPAGHEALS